MMSAVQGDFHATQQGVGLVEVLVALLLLAVAALGYSALQARSIGTTDQALVQTESQLILSNMVERIRINGTSKEVLKHYDTHLTAKTAPSPVTCSPNCTSEDVAKNDVAVLRQEANAQGIKLGMVTCPGTSANTAANTKCIIAAWNDTNATMADSAETQSCIKTDGTYFANADCVYMEAY